MFLWHVAFHLLSHPAFHLLIILISTLSICMPDFKICYNLFYYAVVGCDLPLSEHFRRVSYLPVYTF